LLAFPPESGILIEGATTGRERVRTMAKLGSRTVELSGGLALVVALSGCNSFDAPGPEEGEPVLVIPVDKREAQASPTRVPAISGGTLLITADGRYAVASDPDRDRVSIVDLSSFSVVGNVALEPGDEPGRAVEDAQKRVHVALRRGGALVTIDPSSAAIVERRAVCKSPRGVAFEPSTALLHVACSEGKLVSLPASGGAAVRSLTLDTDLRDVLVRGNELWVTRFKSAEVLRLAASTGAVTQRSSLATWVGELPASFDLNGAETRPAQTVTLAPSVAWRAASSGAGAAVVVHQHAVIDDIPITPPSVQGSAYGGGGGGFSQCGGIVRNAVSVVGAEGTATTIPFAGAPLPVDVAVSPDQLWVAIAHAGLADFEAPRPSLFFPGGGIDGDSPPIATFGFGGGPLGGSLTVLPLNQADGDPSCRFNQAPDVIMEPISAVAFTPSGSIVAQALEPPHLLLLNMQTAATQTLDLPGDVRRDTGHEVFHRDAGGGIACASCHPEGAEDGHTWQFLGTGARRTQALHVGLRDTAPFHWNGDLPGVADVMSEVFVGRMGGVRQSPERLATLSEWLFSIPSPPAQREATDPAAVRGRALFESASVGCATCHSGSKLTDNLTVAIDSRSRTATQVPSLVGIAYRAPFMHTGCAATLAARFDPACGGDSHGNTSSLSQDEVGDLIAYLETL
jgi:hypothetical protein